MNGLTSKKIKSGRDYWTEMPYQLTELHHRPRIVEEDGEKKVYHCLNCTVYNSKKDLEESIKTCLFHLQVRNENRIRLLKLGVKSRPYRFYLADWKSAVYDIAEIMNIDLRGNPIYIDMNIPDGLGDDVTHHYRGFVHAINRIVNCWEWLFHPYRIIVNPFDKQPLVRRFVNLKDAIDYYNRGSGMHFYYYNKSIYKPNRYYRSSLSRL